MDDTFKRIIIKAEKEMAPDVFKQFKDDLARVKQIPLGIEIHNQSDEWRIAQLKDDLARVTVERDAAHDAAIEKAAGKLQSIADGYLKTGTFIQADILAGYAHDLLALKTKEPTT